MTFSKAAIKSLQTAKKIAVLTGAGISAESGVPTFRDPDGLWAKFKPEELANFDAFMSNPQLVWEWYEHRREIVRSVQPNAGHLALAQLEKQSEQFTLITQNVDGLHHRAGSQNVLELHGNLMRSYCIDCRQRQDEVQLSKEHPFPLCSNCGGKVRPDIVWFGEMLPLGIFEDAENAARHCDLFLVIGTSAVVYPAAALPLYAKKSGAFVIEINAEPTEISHLVDESLLGLSGEILPLLLEASGF